MEPIQLEPEVCIQHISHYKPLDDNGTLVYEKYKTKISEQIRETFPSVPSSFDLKPATVRYMYGCGAFYDYMVALPDQKYAKVSFHTGGMCIPSPDGEAYKEPEPTFTVDPTLTSTSTPDE